MKVVKIRGMGFECRPSPTLLCQQATILYYANGTFGGRMNFIERMFGVSPDGGNGSLELLYLVTIAAAITLIVVALYRRRARGRMRSKIKSSELTENGIRLNLPPI
jgi:hypothetical protein